MSRRTLGGPLWSITYDPRPTAHGEAFPRVLELARSDAGRRIAIRVPSELDLGALTLFAALQANHTRNIPAISIMPARTDIHALERMQAKLPCGGAVLVPTVRGHAEKGERTLMLRRANDAQRTVIGTTVAMPDNGSTRSAGIVVDRSVGVVFLRPPQVIEALRGQYLQAILAMRSVRFSMHKGAQAHRQLRGFVGLHTPKADRILDGLDVRAFDAEGLPLNAGLGLFPLVIPSSSTRLIPPKPRTPRPGPRGQLWRVPEGVARGGSFPLTSV